MQPRKTMREDAACKKGIELVFCQKFAKLVT
jgi:hypothetical protein